jgi:hypothetical protein
VIVGVPLSELAKCEDLARGAFLSDRIPTFSHRALRLARQFARVGESHGWVAAQRQALLATGFVAVKDVQVRTSFDVTRSDRLGVASSK